LVSDDGWWLAQVVIAVAATFGLVWQTRQGRLRAAARVGSPTLPEQVLRRMDAVAAVTLLSADPVRSLTPLGSCDVIRAAAPLEPPTSF
jgi:hypothetical protein